MSSAAPVGSQAMPSAGIDDLDPGQGTVVLEVMEAPGPESEMKDKGELARMTVRRFSDMARGKREKEEEAIEAMLAYKGEYSADVLSKIPPGKSKAFVKLTRTRVQAARSLILQIMLDEDGFPWDIRPCADPDLDVIDPDLLREAMAEAIHDLPAPVQAQILKDHDYQAMKDAKTTAAQIACDGMRRSIQEQFDEMNWVSRFVHSLDDLIIHGTAVFQMTNVPKRTKRWKQDPKGSWKVALQKEAFEDKSVPAEVEDEDPKEEELRPDARQVGFFDIYVDPSCTCLEDCEDLIVRHVYARHQFRGLQDLPGYDAEAIQAVLDDHADKGNWVPQWWEDAQARASDHETSSSMIDRFEVLEWWGYLSGRKLMEYGIKVPEEQLERDCVACIVTCGDTLIKVVVSNMQPERLPFFFVPYETVPGSPFGRGVPAQINDSQAQYNACQRAKLDNMAVSAGFQAVVDIDCLVDPNDLSIMAWKVWKTQNTAGRSELPVKFFQPQSNAVPMGEMQAQILQHMQMETSLPDFAMGLPTSPAHNRTAEGLSMQRDSALAFIRSVIGNVDLWLTEPLVTWMYDWNMQFNQDPEIKGDYEVVARGVVGAMAKEVLTQRINQLLASSSANQDLGDWIKKDSVIQLWCRVMGFGDLDLVHTLKEVQAIRAERAQLEAQTQATATRYQPVMPKENALVQMLDHADPGTALFSTLMGDLAESYGVMDARMCASLNALNQAYVANVANLITPQDASAISTDLTPQQQENGNVQPSAGQAAPQNPAGPLPAGGVGQV